MNGSLWVFTLVLFSPDQMLPTTLHGHRNKLTAAYNMQIPLSQQNVTIKAYKINMFCNFLNTCAWCGRFFFKFTEKRTGSFPSLEHLPEVRGNPYLAACSDFIPRNSLLRPPHPVAERITQPEGR